MPRPTDHLAEDVLGMPSVPHTAADYGRLNEHELVTLAKLGRRGAFAAIMQRYNQRLFRVARSILRDEAEAEDALQEAYVRAFAALAGFRAEARLLTWLTRIVINEARGRLRKRRPVVDLAQVEAAQQSGGLILMFPTFGAQDPERQTASDEARRLLEQAVDELPEAFRVVFVLREIEDCDVEETAAHLGLKPQTVKTRLHRARRLLRASLDEKLAGAMTGAFPFLGARCARITGAVLDRLPPAPVASDR